MVNPPLPVFGSEIMYALGRRLILASLLCSTILIRPTVVCAAENTGIIPDGVVVNYVETFNRHDTELYPQAITNAHATDFLLKNIPRFQCPDKEVERVYYFRWWTFRKHLRKTADHGYVITEFLATVPQGGPENVISCAGGHHFREGRWLRDAQYLNDYARFWLTGPARTRALRRYSFWVADSLLQQARATGDDSLARELLPALIQNYSEWVKLRRDPNGLFWQRDLFDGMEESSAFAEFGGKPNQDDNHYRVTINSYLAADALAIAALARRIGDEKTAARFAVEAADIIALRDAKLWDEKAQFYKVAWRGSAPQGTLRFNTDRELHGYVPWYFDNTLPAPERDIAWRQLADPQGFWAPYGPTSCEQRGRGFLITYTGRFCQWNGPAWPFATAQTLTALANLINLRAPSADLQQYREDWLRTFQCYVRSHQLRLDDGTLVPWIDENVNPVNGDWLSRSRFKVYNNGKWREPAQHSKDYNHSTFCDLVLTGVAGLRPAEGSAFTVNPIIPESWDYFCLDNVKYHRRNLTIIYDKTGLKYNQGAGLRVLIDHKPIAASAEIGRPLKCAL